MRNKKLLGIAILILITAIGTSCSWSTPDKTEPATASMAAPTSMSIWTCWDEAMALGRQWREDAYLFEIGVGVVSPYNPNGGVGFGFRSPSEDLLMFSASCTSSRPGFRQTEADFDFLPSQEGCVPITREDIAIDSSRALEIALTHGGEKYLWHEDTEVSLHLYRDLPRCGGRTFWYARISRLSVLEVSGITVIIDALTGEVTEIW